MCIFEQKIDIEATIISNQKEMFNCKGNNRKFKKTSLFLNPVIKKQTSKV